MISAGAVALVMSAAVGNTHLSPSGDRAEVPWGYKLGAAGQIMMPGSKHVTHLRAMGPGNARAHQVGGGLPSTEMRQLIAFSPRKTLPCQHLTAHIQHENRAHYGLCSVE